VARGLAASPVLDIDPLSFQFLRTVVLFVPFYMSYHTEVYDMNEWGDEKLTRTGSQRKSFCTLAIPAHVNPGSARKQGNDQNLSVLPNVM